MITVVGLGCCPEDLTKIGRKTIRNASQVYVRTFLTRAGKGVLKLAATAKSFDEVFEGSQDFDELCDAIVDRLSTVGDAVYCVDGSGTDDVTVVKLAQKCSVNIIAGVSVEAQALAFAPSTRVTALCATEISADKCFYAPCGTLVVKEIDDRYLAGELKLTLLEAYGERSCIFVREGKGTTILLSELDRQRKYGYSSSLVIPEITYTQKSRFSFDDLMRIIFRLRQPDGCPWDKAQTHESIRNCCLEEAYELVEAIDLSDIDKMTEECGDVMLQGLFHAGIAQDCGEFSVTDVISGICTKLINRHAHIFGQEKASNDAQALAVWENAKAKEKAQYSYSERMRQVAKTLPALTLAAKYAKIADKSGFGVSDTEYVRQQLQKALPLTEQSNEAECGEVLFLAAELVRRCGKDPELALLGAINKFKDSFALMEATITAQGKSISDYSFSELCAKFNEVKNAAGH